MLSDPPATAPDDSGERSDPDPASADAEQQERSFAEDVNALYEDGLLYVDAEIAYQKKRAAFAANRAKSGVAFMVVAFAFAHLGLIGLTVGAVLALAPLLTPVGATLAVGGVLLALASLCTFFGVRRFAKAGSVFSSNDDDAAS